MISKIIKYTLSWIRIIKYKIIFGRRFRFRGLKHLYFGKGIKISIDNGCTLEFGEKIYIEDYCKFQCLGGNIIVGNNTYFNFNCNIVALDGINIGKDCLFGPNVGIYDHNHCFSDLNKRIALQGFSKERILLKNNIWIGANCTITKGVQIESCTIVGANSVINNIIKDSGLYGGIPAKFIKNIS
ncbi:acyltransferase [Clostridium sp.]|uniref:acyltransferase n=1 Tax=Clostridium sp. TaxID=1506 RepID=UPI00290610BF|nr:acyltransferase [Clostridium sp.]MDU6542638.1 acyltransferase [Clostridium sp.]